MATSKKTTKVVTPIDERETFMSLRKSFADSEATTHDKLKVLYALQQADIAIDKLVQLRGELPAEVESLEAELETYKAKLAHVQEVVAGYGQTVELKKQAIVEIDAEIAKYQAQLEQISNSREYDSINKELENLSLERQIAEKNIKDAGFTTQERQEDIEALTKRVNVLEEDLKIKKEELSTIVESTAKEEVELVEKRDSLAAQIDERTLSAYKRICTSAHNHLAVVPVFNNDSCGGCFNIITPQRLVDIASGKKLVICEHCGRIIVNPEA